MNAKKVSLMLAGALLVAVPGAGAGEPREAQLAYKVTDDNRSVGGPEPVQVANFRYLEQTYEFSLRKGERFVTVDLVDDSEKPVAGVVSQWVEDSRTGQDGNYASTGHAVTYVRFCGETAEPVKLKKKLDVVVMVNSGTCADGTPSAPTNGDIVANFFKK